MVSWNGFAGHRRRAAGLGASSSITASWPCASAPTQAFADIDVQLRQRHDLIPNLVETVKGYASHEKETLDAVRQGPQRGLRIAHGPADQAAAGEYPSTPRWAVCSRWRKPYPDLKANQNFLALQSELSNVEDKLAAHGGSSTMPWPNTTPPSNPFRRCCSPARSVSQRANISISAKPGARRCRRRRR